MKLTNKIVRGAVIEYEEFCYLHSTVSVIASIRVGAYSYCGEASILGACEIGRFCSIAPNVTIGLGEHEVSYVSTHPFFFSSKNGFPIPDGIGVPRNFTLSKHQKTIIGSDVWVGSNVYISKGVKIGDGAVIAAGAVVTKDVEPYSIVGGVPARHIRYRFDDNMIKRLLTVQWWKYELESFRGLDASNPDVFLNSLESKNNIVAKYQWKTQS